MKHLLQEELKDETTTSPGLSGYTNTEEPPPATEIKAAGDSSDTSKDSANQEGTPDKETKTDDQSKQTETPNITGYDESDDIKIETKTDDKKTETDDKSGIDDTKVVELELDLKGLKYEEVTDLKEFAKENKLSKDQAQKLLDKRKEALDNQAKLQADFEAEKKTVYKKWTDDLKNDPDFGGQNFKNSLHAVNKLLETHMPGTAKLLTDSGKRLSPIQMKELRAIALKLSDEGTLELGGTTTTTKERQPWDVYNN